jgi:hypothetical protein
MSVQVTCNALKSVSVLSLGADNVERNCHFPAPGWNCTTHYQALQGFPDTSQEWFHKSNKINLPTFIEMESTSVFLKGETWIKVYRQKMEKDKWVYSIY